MKAFFSVLDLKDHEAIRVLNATFKWFLKKLSLNVYFKHIYFPFMFFVCMQKMLPAIGYCLPCFTAIFLLTMKHYTFHSWIIGVATYTI